MSFHKGASSISAPEKKNLSPLRYKERRCSYSCKTNGKLEAKSLCFYLAEKAMWIRKVLLGGIIYLMYTHKENSSTLDVAGNSTSPVWLITCWVSLNKLDAVLFSEGNPHLLKFRRTDLDFSFVCLFFVFYLIGTVFFFIKQRSRQVIKILWNYHHLAKSSRILTIQTVLILSKYCIQPFVSLWNIYR